MTWNVERLVHEFGLRRDTAAEIIAEQTQLALRRNWQPWAWAAVTVPPAIWTIFQWRHSTVGAVAVGVAMFGWHWIGVRMAQPGILAAAKARAARIAACGP